MLDYQKTRAWQSGDVRHGYSAKDVILYALGVGAGADPCDETQLRLIYEKNLAVLPSMATVLASPGFWMRDTPELGIDYLKLVHGEQSVELLRPLRPDATLIGRSRVTRLVDKGEGKGAVMHVEKQLIDEPTQQVVAITEQVLFLRGDGGFSNGSGGDRPVSSPSALPESPPDQIIELTTRPDQAALYRLSGDLNPLHIDPAVAARAGFPKPILHGLASYGIVCRGLVQACCAGDPARLTAMRARLSAPVYPGETIQLECWRAGDRVAFQGRVPAREVTVITHGRATIQAARA